MLEWKARILSLLIAAGFVFGQYGEFLRNNWNW
jgi:hypothetical protein